jgi:undecaprenyl-diphosphatase
MIQDVLRKMREEDARWSRWLHIGEEPGPLRSAAILLAHSGDSWFWFLGLALVWALGRGRWQAWAAKMIVVIVLTAALVMALKFSIRRRRPEGTWGDIYRATDPHSFPSGHAARAALIAILSLAWAPPWLALPLLVWAPLVAWARVAMGLHYLSDVLVGGLLGGLMAAVRLLSMP